VIATLSTTDRAALIDFLYPKYEYLFNKAQATSVRVATALGEPAKIREAFDLLYSTPGAAIMYYGDELGMRNLTRQDGVVDTRRYVRGDFNWKEADAEMRDSNSLWRYVATLTRRASAPALPSAMGATMPAERKEKR